MRLRRYICVVSLVTLILIPLSFSNCSKEKMASGPVDRVLVSVGDSSLTVDDVIRVMPAGLSPEDSIEFVRTHAEGWLRRMALLDFAKKNLVNYDEIDRLVEDYRNTLLVERYLQQMDVKVSDISDSEINRYYDSNGDSMTLEGPIVKGVYIKIPESEPRIEDVRKWMRAGTDEAVDNIEKFGLSQAIQYEYFNDRWVDWSEIAEHIPYRFYDADAFLESSKDFETEYNGSVYMLHISEFIPSGKEMPLAYARGEIRKILFREHSRNYRDRFIRSIYSKEIKDGKLKPGLYDPITGKLEQPTK